MEFICFIRLGGHEVLYLFNEWGCIQQYQLLSINQAAQTTYEKTAIHNTRFFYTFTKHGEVSKTRSNGCFNHRRTLQCANYLVQLDEHVSPYAIHIFVQTFL